MLFWFVHDIILHIYLKYICFCVFRAAGKSVPTTSQEHASLTFTADVMEDYLPPPILAHATHATHGETVTLRTAETHAYLYLGVLSVFFRRLHPGVLSRTFLDTLPIENSFEAGSLGVGHLCLPWPRQPVRHLGRAYEGGGVLDVRRM